MFKCSISSSNLIKKTFSQAPASSRWREASGQTCAVHSSSHDATSGVLRLCPKRQFVWIQPWRVSCQLPAKSWSVCAEDRHHHWYVHCPSTSASSLLFSLMTDVMINCWLICVVFCRFQTWTYQAPTARQMSRPESPLDRASISSEGPKVQTPLSLKVTTDTCSCLCLFHCCLCVVGTYIRTSDGRIFAVRAANKPKTGEENAASSPAKSKII